VGIVDERRAHGHDLLLMARKVSEKEAVIVASPSFVVVLIDGDDESRAIARELERRDVVGDRHRRERRKLHGP
jgi:hypothetical protein